MDKAKLDPELTKISLHFIKLAEEEKVDAQWKAMLRYFENQGIEECKQQ